MQERAAADGFRTDYRRYSTEGECAVMGVISKFEPESIPAVFKNGHRKTFTQPLFRYDYGQKIRFIGIELPRTFTVHFSNTEELGTATTAIGQDNEVRIPDEYLRHSWEHIFAFVFLSGSGCGQTVWEVVIPVVNRPGLSDPQPTPVEESVIQQAIGIMNDAIETVEGATETIRKAEEIIGGFTSGNIIIDGRDADSICGGEDLG